MISMLREVCFKILENRSWKPSCDIQSHVRAISDKIGAEIAARASWPPSVDSFKVLTNRLKAHSRWRLGTLRDVASYEPGIAFPRFATEDKIALGLNPLVAPRQCKTG